ncbi:hypothetical protein GOB93_08160 [Acetobacter musti]|uniref:Uncharacterized protein n=1 Tax=Acetobacter musti TaxID=864732 RepID=A0ABX0JRF3_9PROT|nr:hypothetical protein [Acetobacter musti]NHN84618.1 hypothetical protein [Acetobacter musti]
MTTGDESRINTSQAEPLQQGVSRSDLSGNGAAPPGHHTAHIDTPDGRRIWRDMLDHAPQLETLIRYIALLQARTAGLHLPWYQQELFERRFFRVPSPVTGRMIHSGEARLAGAHATIFRLPDIPGLLLASTGLSDAQLTGIRSTDGRPGGTRRPAGTETAGDKSHPIDAILAPGLNATLLFGAREAAPLPPDALNAFPAPPQAVTSAIAVYDPAIAPDTLLPLIHEIAALPRYVAPVRISGLPASLTEIAARLSQVETDGSGPSPASPLTASGQVVFRLG